MLLSALGWLLDSLRKDVPRRFFLVQPASQKADPKMVDAAAQGLGQSPSFQQSVLALLADKSENPADAPAVTSIRDFIDDPAEDELIRASIAYHSDFRLPAQLDERTRSFCDIVRDGDKIDIMRTIADSTVDTILKVDEDTFLASHFSTPALTAFNEHRCVTRDERDEPADFLVGLICFMFELVYPASRALAREQGDIYRLLDAPFGITRPFTDPAAQATWERLKKEMRAWLAGA